MAKIYTGIEFNNTPENIRSLLPRIAAQLKKVTSSSAMLLMRKTKRYFLCFTLLRSTTFLSST